MTSVTSPLKFDDLIASVTRNVKELNLIEKEVENSTFKNKVPLKIKSPLKPSNSVNINAHVKPKNADSLRKLALKKATAKENALLSSPLKSRQAKDIHDFASQLVALSSKVKDWLYCPLCPLRYRKESSLGMHVKSQHTEDLVALNKKHYTSFTYQNCPSCSSKFFKLGVLARHLTLYHSEIVLDIWDAANHQKKACYFCKEPFEGAKTDMIINHVVSQHAEQFETLALIYLKKRTNESSVKTNEASQLLSPGATRSILRNTGVQNKTAKRALRFSVPEAVCHFYEKPSSGSSSSESSMEKAETPDDMLTKETDTDKSEELHDVFQLSVLTSPQPKFCGFMRSKSPRPKFTSTPIKRQRKSSNLPGRLHSIFHTALSPHSPSKLYRCAACRVRFGSNSDLLTHMKIHKGIHTKLRPLYSCGVCAAQFYKNEFLLKHCADHPRRPVNTPPKCINVRDVLFNNVSNFSPLH